MTDDLEHLIEAMVRHQAHRHHCSLATARCQIRGLVAEAREDYRAAGAPYGDDDRDFCRLSPRMAISDRRFSDHAWKEHGRPRRSLPYQRRTSI